MPTDRELVLQVLDEHEGAFDRLIRRHEAFVRCALAGQTWTPRQDLDDLLQELWIKLWRNNYCALRQWRGLTEGPVTVSLRPYLRTIAIRILLDQPRRDELPWLDLFEDPPADPPPYGEPGDVERVMEAALRVCVNRDYQIVRLYYLDEARVEDIACMFNLSERGVRTVLYRCIRRIRPDLGLE